MDEKAEMLTAGREKYWSELAIEEKIERMRGVVKNLQSEQEETHDLLRKLIAHKHLGDSIVVDFHNGLGGVMRPSMGRSLRRHALRAEEEWF